MNQAPTARIDQEEERHRMTLDALEDVNAGRVIHHQAVQAWADSLGTVKALRRTRHEVPSAGETRCVEADD